MPVANPRSPQSSLSFTTPILLLVSPLPHPFLTFLSHQSQREPTSGRLAWEGQPVVTQLEGAWGRPSRKLRLLRQNLPAVQRGCRPLQGGCPEEMLSTLGCLFQKEKGLAGPSVRDRRKVPLALFCGQFISKLTTGKITFPEQQGHRYSLLPLLNSLLRGAWLARS